MEKLPNRKSIRLPGYDYSTPGAYFLTLCTENRKCVLSRIPVGTGVLDGPQINLLPFGKIADKYIRQLNDFYDNLRVESYVIMPNHIHILLTVQSEVRSDGPSGRPVPTPQNSAVSRFVSTLKRFCNKECGRNIWQSRFYDHIIRSQDDYDEHLRYIHDNPFRWQEDELFSMD